jgi:hypothetical protein
MIGLGPVAGRSLGKRAELQRLHRLVILGPSDLLFVVVAHLGNIRGSLAAACWKSPALELAPAIFKKRLNLVSLRSGVRTLEGALKIPAS